VGTLDFKVKTPEPEDTSQKWGNSKSNANRLRQPPTSDPHAAAQPTLTTARPGSPDSGVFKLRRAASWLALTDKALALQGPKTAGRYHFEKAGPSPKAPEIVALNKDGTPGSHWSDTSAPVTLQSASRRTLKKPTRRASSVKINLSFQSLTASQATPRATIAGGGGAS
jgi:hypothetical protein